LMRLFYRGSRYQRRSATSSPIEDSSSSRKHSMTIRPFTVLILAAGALCQLLYSQTSRAADAAVVLTVEVQNATTYRGDTFDISKIAKDPGPMTSVNQALVTSFNIGICGR
jgi:hypothetical protein